MERCCIPSERNSIIPHPDDRSIFIRCGKRPLYLETCESPNEQIDMYGQCHFVCPSSGIFADPESKYNYYSCNKDCFWTACVIIARRKRCPYRMEFSEMSRRCVLLTTSTSTSSKPTTTPTTSTTRTTTPTT